MLNRIKNTLEALSKFTDVAEVTVVDLVAKLAPWAAPLPTAYLVYSRSITHLHWPPWVALTAAIVIESLGLSTTATALRLYNYNATRKQYPSHYTTDDIKKSRMRVDPKAPMVLPLLLVGTYVITAELLTVILDISSKPSLTLVDYAPAVFPLLSLTGVTILATRAAHTQRLAAIERGRSPLTPKRKEKPKGPQVPDWAIPYLCWCGWWPGIDEDLTEKPANTPQRVAGHSRRHYREASAFDTPTEANTFLHEKYPKATEETWPTLRTIAGWQKKGETPFDPQGMEKTAE